MRTADPMPAAAGEPFAQSGFTLLEAVICAAILTIVSAAALGAFAAVARNAAEPSARDAASAVAENALVRARAAVAYAPVPAAGTSAQTPGPAGRPWGLQAGEHDYVAGALLGGRASCGGTAPALARLPVAASYDAANERFTVVVTYPRDPCRLASDGSVPPDDAANVSLTELLPPSAYAPGATVYRDIAPPARM